MRYAVIGTGWIVDSYIQGASLAGGWELSAVCSRSREKGLAFGEKYGVSTVYTTPEALAADPSIEAVYIASPNSLHYAQSRTMLLSGKHVLCEKPVTVLPEECQELQTLAAERGLIYLEAIMMLHLPQRQAVLDALPALGRITSAHLDFSQLSSKYAAYTRGELPNIFNPRMATGSLMDLGVYCVYPALDWFGLPRRITAAADFLSSGADGSCAAILEYPDKLVTLCCSKTGQSRLGSEIFGDAGTLTLESISKLTGIRLYQNDGSFRTLAGEIDKPVLMSGEARDFLRYITSPEETREEYAYASRMSLEVSRTMAEIRRLAGIRFPGYEKGVDEP